MRVWCGDKTELVCFCASSHIQSNEVSLCPTELTLTGVSPTESQTTPGFIQSRLTTTTRSVQPKYAVNSKTAHT